MKLNWTQGLATKEKEDFLRLLSTNTIVLNRLEDLVKGFDLEASTVSEADLDKPNWSDRQTFKAGQRSAYKKVLQLLDPGARK